MKNFSRIALVLFSLMTFYFVFGSRNFDLRAFKTFWDMRYSPAYKAQEDNPVFANGKTNQLPPEHTIARGFHPSPYTSSQADRDRASAELKNPVEDTLKNLNRGRTVFERFCQPCHGFSGAGNGAVAKAFPGFTMPINSSVTADRTDGEIFHIITFGRRAMPGYQIQISRQDRWKAIKYLRVLQGVGTSSTLSTTAVLISKDKNVSSVATSSKPVSKPLSGKQLFANNCSSCHGKEGMNPLKGIPTLNLPSVLSYTKDDFYRQTIQNGRQGTQMIAWKDILGSQKIESIIKYIRSWNSSKKRPFISFLKTRAGRKFLPPGQIPSSSRIVSQGAKLFRSFCASCHGSQGKGSASGQKIKGYAPSLNNQDFLNVADEKFLLATIVLGRPGTGMHSFVKGGNGIGALSAQEVKKIVAFIRAWKK